MHRMNGRVLAQRVIGMRPRTRVLFMSGYTENIIANQGFPDSEINYVPKPLTPERLLTKVRQVLDAPARQLEAAAEPRESEPKQVA